VTGEIVNVDQANAWNGHEGDAWTADQARYDAVVGAYHTTLLAAAGIAHDERVLDIGCGCGTTTLDAARAAPEGRALGVDLSAQMLELARTRAAEEHLTNVSFEQADAQVCPFDAAAFDVVISRFGVMFFSDPLAAFSNIAEALRPGGRFVAVVWQPLEDNEWLGALREALAMGRTLPAPATGAPGPFGLADPDAVRRLLGDAGFVDVALEPVKSPVVFGTDVDDAFDFAQRMPPVRGMLQDLDDATAARALEHLRDALVAHAGPDAVTFGSAVWIITAHVP
jgi:SAM-dependent methyltransferase